MPKRILQLFYYFLYIIVIFFPERTLAQGNCSDTTQRNHFFFDSDTSIGFSKNCLQESGRSYVLSKSWKISSTPESAIVSKYDFAGETIWSRELMIIENDSVLTLSEVVELSDNTIVVFGIIQSKQSPFQVSQSPTILHLDQNGLIVNSWRINLKETGTINGFFKAFLRQIDASSIALAINYPTEDFTSVTQVMKFNVNSGSCEWIRKFFKNRFYYTNGMIINSNELILLNNFSDYTGPSLERQGINLIKINAITGSILASKSFENNFTNSLPSASNNASIQLLSDGNYKILANTSRDNEPNKVSILKVDEDFNQISAKALANINDNYLVRNFSVNASGNFAFSFFNSLNLNDQGYIVVDNNNIILKQKKFDPTSGTNYSMLFSNNDVSLNENQILSVFTGLIIGTKVQYEKSSIPIYSEINVCETTEFNELYIEDFVINTSNWALDHLSGLLPEFVEASIINKSKVIQHHQVCLNIQQINIGLPDTLSKCNSDSLMIKANSGFISYDWYDQTSSIIINDSTLKVFPQTTREYILSAKTYLGCTLKDSVTVLVNNSTPINLPKDTSICSGNQIVLDAGENYISYEWNDGSTDRYKTIHQPGTYLINAIDNNQCVSVDSFSILNVYAIPTLDLGSDTILCRGQNDKLFAGNHTSYLWNDGSSNQDITITSPGLYWVDVKNENECFASDTIKIIAISDPPENFIFADSTICIFETLRLTPYRTFQNYLWNDGSTQPFININHAGIYTLQVSDVNGCTGNAQINISQKDCPNSMIFPSAFTPNSDGKNDIFKPFLKGEPLRYNLSVYNRWGQKIFNTNNPRYGWNGTYNSNQLAGTFVWVCSYQFIGEINRIQKGTLVLIK